jgi:hypothetical protein
MDFKTLVDEIEKRFPGKDYDVSVEMSQEENFQCCKHSSKTKRTLSWKYYSGGISHKAETPEKLLAAIDGPKEVPADLDLVGNLKAILTPHGL